MPEPFDFTEEDKEHEQEEELDEGEITNGDKTEWWEDDEEVWWEEEEEDEEEQNDEEEPLNLCCSQQPLAKLGEKKKSFGGSRKGSEGVPGLAQRLLWKTG